MTAQRPERVSVFISYSHQDAAWLKRLRVHLKPLEREKRLEIWDDTRIKAGSKWKEEIRQALAATKVAVLLVSADFLASDFIVSDELPSLLSAAEEEGAVILPLILSPSRFERITNLAQFQAVNDVSKPLIGMRREEQEAVLVKIADDIEAALTHSPIVAAAQLRTGDNGTTTGVATKTNQTKFPRSQLVIWAAIIGGLVALVTGYWQFIYKSSSDSDGKVQYAGRVIDQTSQRVIRGAKVSVEVQGHPQVFYTDSDGVFNLPLRNSGSAIRIRVDADGYEPLERNVSSSRDGIEDVRLTRTSPPPQPSPSLAPDVALDENGNKIASDRTPVTQPKAKTTSDLRMRKQDARQDLDYVGPTPTP